MTHSEDRATKKINKILSRLHPEAAARVARSMAETFAVEAAGEDPARVRHPPAPTAESVAPARGAPMRVPEATPASQRPSAPRPEGAATAPEPTAPPVRNPGDKRPSFLQTEFRMAVGKELLDKEKTGS
jgi:hypothetical protein